MDMEMIREFGQIAGIGGIALGVVLFIFGEVVRKGIFPMLTKEQGYRLMRLILCLVWITGLAGIGAWVWVSTNPIGGVSDNDSQSTEWTRNHIVYNRLRAEGTDGISRMQSGVNVGQTIFFRGVHKDDTMRRLSELNLDGPLLEQRNKLLNELHSSAEVPQFPNYVIFYDSIEGLFESESGVILEQAYKSFLDALEMEVAVYLRE